MFGTHFGDPPSQGPHCNEHGKSLCADGPLFIFTTDLDWASEFAIELLLSDLADLGIKPTVFVTHESRIVSEFAARSAVDVGLHPNFLPGSTHGQDMISVIDHVFALVKHAESFRAHAFYDHSRVCLEMVRRGIKYDSNLGLCLQDNLVPLRHCSGLIRFPVFWEDDVHFWRRSSWRFDQFHEAFFTPGLKVINVHPFIYAINAPTFDFYESHKSHITSLDSASCGALQFRGEGPRTFVRELLETVLKKGHRFLCLAEAYRQMGFVYDDFTRESKA